jgi:dockerin type I repeat protein
MIRTILIAVALLLLTSIAFGQTVSPAVFYTDLQSGPNTGGDSQSGYSGVYVTLYGNNFGTSQGSSSVTLNGASCMRVVSWGTTWLWYQKIVVQLGSTCTSGNLVVTTSAGASNATLFTVRSGNIYCISTGGSDSATGKFPSTCWSTLASALGKMVAGDVVYLENGVSNTGISAFSASVNIQGSPGGTAASPIAMLAYPGATATIGDINNSQYGIRIPQVGVNPAYYVIGGLTVRGNEAMDLAFSDHFWVIGNDISCSGATGFGCMHVDQSTNYFVYGNYMHDVAYNCSVNSGNPTGSPCKFHGFYFTTNTNHVQMGWNTLDMNPAGHTNAGCYGIQFYSTGGADQFDEHVHDNIVRNVVCGGINFSTVNPGGGTVEAYNNVLYHVGTGPDPSGNAAGYYCISTSSSGTATSAVQLYNNSLYDCGARGPVTNTNAAFWLTIPTVLKNNVYQSTGSSEIYISSGSSTLSCSNISGSNNAFFGNGSAPCTSSLTGSLNVNPLFVSTTAGSVDLHLQASSPMVNAGTAIGTLTRDITGVPRPQGSALDIGAYEYASGGPPPTPTCDLNGDGVVNGTDVTLAINQALGLGGNAIDLDGDGTWNVVDVQRVINAANGQACRIGS